MGWKLCPICELNYIPDDQEMCDICIRARMGAPEDYMTLCDACGENPAIPGEMYCEACLAERNSTEATEDEEVVLHEPAVLSEEDAEPAVAETDEIEAEITEGFDDVIDIDTPIPEEFREETDEDEDDDDERAAYNVAADEDIFDDDFGDDEDDDFDDDEDDEDDDFDDDEGDDFDDDEDDDFDDDEDDDGDDDEDDDGDDDI